jgi:Rieske Fe-S protein
VKYSINGYKISLVFLIIFFFFSGCKKEDQSIPNIYVNFTIQPNSTLYQKLNTVGGYEYFTGGYSGIVIYRDAQEHFVAFDRACPYDFKNGCRVQVESSFTTAIDSCCMSQFILNDGSPFKGPAKVSLKQYRTYYDGVNLSVYN